MTHYHIKPRIVTTVAALTLVPALALAQAGSDTTQGSQQQGSQGGQQQGSQQQDPRGSQQQDPQGSQQQDPQGGQQQGAQDSQQQGAQDSQQQGSPGAGMSGSHPGAASDPSMPGATSSMDQTRATIDPSEIQRVFGRDASLVDLSKLSSDELRSLQQKLKDKGHYQGEVDGQMGPQTRAALNAVVSQQFELTRRLINQGKITGQLAESMGLSTQGLAPVTGVDTGSPTEQTRPASPSPEPMPSNPPPTVYPEQGPQTDDTDMGDAPEQSP